MADTRSRTDNEATYFLTGNIVRTRVRHVRCIQKKVSDFHNSLPTSDWPLYYLPISLTLSADTQSRLFYYITAGGKNDDIPRS